MREEPRFVTARAGESVILGCDVSPPLDGQQPPYVVEWFKFGVPIPFFINFRFYPPHVDPEYTGKMSANVAEIQKRLKVIIVKCLLYLRQIHDQISETRSSLPGSVKQGFVLVAL